MRSSFLLSSVIITVLASLSLSGCGGDGPPRVDLWGTVNWKGQPVPRGVIYFGPDGRKGNTGPQGYVLIQDGRFDTRRSPAKGCVVGPHIVQIDGCDGQDIRNGYPYGNQLFAPYEASLDISAEGGEIDLVVPDTVKAAPPSINEPD
jgi:hypothetical protein